MGLDHKERKRITTSKVVENFEVPADKTKACHIERRSGRVDP